MMENSDTRFPETEAEAVSALVAELGGVRPAAKVIGSPFTTVQYWKRKGSIPAARRSEVRTRAAEFGVSERLLDVALPNLLSEPLPNPLPNPLAEKMPKLSPKPLSEELSDGSYSGGASGPPASKPSASGPSRVASEPVAPLSAEREPPVSSTQDSGASQGVPTSGNGRSALVFTALFLSLLAFGASGWGVVQQGILTAPNVAETLSGLEARVEVLESSQTIAENTLGVDDARVKALEASVETALARLQKSSLESQTSVSSSASDPNLVLKRIETLEARQVQLSASGGDLNERLLALSDNVMQKFLTSGQRAQEASRDRDSKMERLYHDLTAVLKAEEEERLRSFAEIAQAVDRLDRSNLPAAQRVLSVLTLRHVSRTQAPFQDSLDIVRLTHEGFESADPIVEELASFSQDGVATPETLLRGVPELTALAAQRILVPAGEAWWRDFVTKLLSLVKVRKVETDTEAAKLSGLDLLALIEQESENSSDNSDASLQAVLVHLDELKEMSPKVAMVFDEWRNSVEARMRVDILTLSLVTQSVAGVASATQ